MTRPEPGQRPMAPLLVGQKLRSLRLVACAVCTAAALIVSGSAFSQTIPPVVTRQATPIPALPNPNPSPRPFRYLRPGKATLPAAKPGERVMLTLESPGGSLKLTRTQLLALPTVRYTTEQPQLHRKFTYEGVPLRDLARLGGFAGKDLRVYASNGFMTVIRASDYLGTPMMLAHTAGGKPIPVLEKGPLTVVIPAEATQFPARLYSRYWVWYAAKISPAP